MGCFEQISPGEADQKERDVKGVLLEPSLGYLEEIPKARCMQQRTISQVLDGEVASYRGARVISLDGVTLSTTDVSLTKAVYQHLENREFQQAHIVACLGATQV